MNVESQSNRNGWMKIVVIAIVIGIAVFQWYTESNTANPNATPDAPRVSTESTNADKGLPSGSTQSQAQNDQKSQPADDYLRPSGGKNLKSPSGLIYTNSRSGHRADHVLRHAHDIPDRPGPHGVFDANGDAVFELIDEAYQLVKTKSDQVKTKPSADGKTEYIIDMKRDIGFVGGQKGQRQNHPKLSKIKLVLGENRVITAYPF